MIAAYDWKYNAKPPVGTEILRQHTLSDGLAACFLFNEGGGSSIIDLVGRIRPAHTGTAAWNVGPTGRTFSIGSGVSSYYTISPGSKLLLPTQRTIYAKAYFSRSDELRLLVHQSRGNDHSWHFGLHWGAFEFGIVQNFSAATINNSSQTWTNRWLDCIGVDRNGTLELWINGVLIVSQASAVTFVGPAQSDIQLFRYSSLNVEGAISDLRLWDRALTTAEIRSLFNDPFQMFAPPVWRKYFVVVGGGTEYTRSVSGDQPTSTGTLARIHNRFLTVLGNQPTAIGTLARIHNRLIALTGAQPTSTGTLSRIQNFLKSLTGNQPASTGTLSSALTLTRSLAGVQPTATGELNSLLVLLRSLVGDQPASSGTLSRIHNRFLTLVGEQLASFGILNRVYDALRTIVGNQPTGTGTLDRSQNRTRSITGSQESSTGTLSNLSIILRSIAGNQPSATGTLVQTLSALRTVIGNQPTSTGTLSRFGTFVRALVGAQLTATGTLARIQNRLRSITGNQPNANGDISYIESPVEPSVTVGLATAIVTLYRKARATVTKSTKASSDIESTKASADIERI